MEDFMPVIDMYDIVTDFAKEFRPIIEKYGPDSFSNIMSKVVSILEHLEAQAATINELNSLLQEKDAIILKLEKDKADKAADRQRFEKELEQIEEHWRNETHELVSMVQRLQEDNKKLSKCVSNQENYLDSSSCGQPSMGEVDLAALHQSRMIIDKLREQLKHKENEVNNRNLDIDNITDQLSRATLQMKELRKKLKLSQGQVRSLIDESADTMGQLRDNKKELEALRQRLGLAQKENLDLVRSSDENPDLRNKLVYDIDDPNRPRFTTKELKAILRERNEFKAKVSDLEEELNQYRPKPEIMPETEYEDDEDDAPVQGPLPLEPSDAPWKRSESGIRKLFKKLFSESNITFLGSSPKHQASLAKITANSVSNKH